MTRLTGSSRLDRTATTTYRSPGPGEDRTTAGFVIFVGLSVAVAGVGLGWAAMAVAGVAVVLGTVAVAHLAAREDPVDPPDVADPVAAGTPAD